MHSILFGIIALLCALNGFAAPLRPRAALACSEQNTTQVGSDIELTQINLAAINALSGATNGVPLLTAQLSLINASDAAAQLVLGIASSDTVNNLSAALADAQANVANITLNNIASAAANNTAALSNAKKFLTQAIDQSKSLGCT
ncbi:hypothetical protein B0H11DRAFT_2009223 [Mycena galericulata]|nr:hypothetical protein B0H11DRAFT_2009223 [Mycena galericulata]